MVSVSVVLPTLGRDCLRRAMRSVANQHLPPLEVIVVNDGGQRLPEELHAMLPLTGIRILETHGHCGAAVARNLGMSAARGDLIAFLDDDDVWLPHHLPAAVAGLERHPDVDVYTSAGLVRYPTFDRVEPTTLYDGRTSLRKYFYGRLAWATRRRRILTSSIVFRRALADHPMDPELLSKQDLWWLFNLERMGYRLAQFAAVGILMHQDVHRERGRLNLRDTLNWAARLDTLEQGMGVNYLVGVVGRQLVRSGDKPAFDALASHLNSLSGVSWDMRLLLAMEAAVGKVRPLSESHA